jgi:hypothetical protein
MIERWNDVLIQFFYDVDVFVLGIDDLMNDIESMALAQFSNDSI